MQTNSSKTFLRAITIPIKPATSKAAECCRIPGLEDPNFTGEYHKWKKMELTYPKDRNLKYAAAITQDAGETKRP